MGVNCPLGIPHPRASDDPHQSAFPLGCGLCRSERMSKVQVDGMIQEHSLKKQIKWTPIKIEEEKEPKPQTQYRRIELPRSVYEEIAAAQAEFIHAHNERIVEEVQKQREKVVVAVRESREEKIQLGQKLRQEYQKRKELKEMVEKEHEDIIRHNMQIRRGDRYRPALQQAGLNILRPSV